MATVAKVKTSVVVPLIVFVIFLFVVSYVTVETVADLSALPDISVVTKVHLDVV